MIILYTDKEGGEWIPFNTPMSVDDIRNNLWGPEDNGAIMDEENGFKVYIPNGDLLPQYIANYKPGQERTLNYWADQGEGWDWETIESYREKEAQ